MLDRTRPRATDGGELPLDQFVAHACEALVREGHSSPPQTILRRFVHFLGHGYGVTGLEDVSASIARSFVDAPTRHGRRPTNSTMHARRSALRLLFRVARQEGLVFGDPTLDLELPARSGLTARPLTDDEIALCRSVAVWDLAGSRRAAAWALAEATCRSSELPCVTSADLALQAATVHIRGGKATEGRVGRLTEWGVQRLAERERELDDPSVPLVYGGRSRSGAGQVAACTAISDVLLRAGLGAEADVRAGSVAAWAGRRVFEETGRIELAAKALGVRSLDRAAGIIAWDWRADEEPVEE